MYKASINDEDPAGLAQGGCGELWSRLSGMHNRGASPTRGVSSLRTVAQVLPSPLLAASPGGGLGFSQIRASAHGLGRSPWWRR